MAIINVDDAYILNETGAQVDKVTGLFTKDEDTTSGEKAFAQLNIGTAGSNRNLLDNPWFTVNQKSVTSGTVATGTAEYFVDRWKTAYATYTINSDKSITTSWNGSGVGAHLIQYFAAESVALLEGKTVTLSVDINGSILTKTFAIPTVAGSGVTYQLGTQVWMKCNNVKNSNRGVEIQIYHTFTNGATIHAVKLELGSVSTLANDAPPDYGTELAKCQRYFQRLIVSATMSVGFGTMTSDTEARVTIPLPVPLRSAPTVSINSIGNFRLIQSGAKTPSDFSYVSYSYIGVALRFVVSTGFTVTGNVSVQINSTSAYIDLSADL